MFRTQLNHLASLAKWLSVHLCAKWFWVQVKLLPFYSFLFEKTALLYIYQLLPLISKITPNISILSNKLDQSIYSILNWKFETSVLCHMETTQWEWQTRVPTMLWAEVPPQMRYISVLFRQTTNFFSPINKVFSEISWKESRSKQSKK